MVLLLTDQEVSSLLTMDEAISSIKASLRRGVSKKEIRHQLEDTNIDDSTIDAVLKKVEEELEKRGKTMEDSSLEDMDKIWEKVKEKY